MQPVSRFSRWLAKAGWTTKALAKRIGASPFTVRSWRVGARRPNKQLLERMALVCKTTTKKLKKLL